MSTLVELQCFNKLLLEKMQRMQKKIEFLEEENLKLDKIKGYYHSLYNVANLDDLYRCAICEWWCDEDEVSWTEMEDEISPICESCYKEKNYYQCNNCGEHYWENEMKKMKDGYDDDVCNRCYKGYIILDTLHEDVVNAGLVDGDVINEMVYDRDEVMEELLKKVKTN